MEINSTAIQLYAENPFTLNREEVESTKITVKDVPLSYSNKDVEKFLKDLGANLTSEIRYFKTRDSQGRLTEFLNGDPYGYAEKQQLVDHPLKRFAICVVGYSSVTFFMLVRTTTVFALTAKNQGTQPSAANYQKLA